MTTAQVDLTAEVVTVRRSGDFIRVALSLSGRCPARPGQFVAVSSVPEAQVLPDLWWLVSVRYDALVGTTWEVLVRPDLPVAQGDEWTLIGPLGRGFTLPHRGQSDIRVLVVAQGEAGAVAGWLAQALRDRGFSLTTCLLPAPESPDLSHLRRSSDQVTHSKIDESRGSLGPALLADHQPEVIYAATTPTVGLEVAQSAAAQRVPAQFLAFDPMATATGEAWCGLGLCRSCTNPAAEQLSPGLGQPALMCWHGPALQVRAQVQAQEST